MEEIKEPNYVLQLNEPVDKRLDTPILIKLLKVFVVLIFTLLIGLSIIVGENVFDEWPFGTKLVVFGVVFKILSLKGKKVREPSPVEIQFYDDCLIIYRPKLYYDKKVIRREFHKYMYVDNPNCVYQRNLKWLEIYSSKIYTTYYNFDSKGIMSPTPTYDRVCDSMCYIRMHLEPNVDIIKEIEEHSPLKVTIK